MNKLFDVSWAAPRTATVQYGSVVNAQYSEVERDWVLLVVDKAGSLLSFTRLQVAVVK